MSDKKHLILVIDDEPDLVELVTYNLKKEGFDTRSLSNGTDVLPTAVALAPDLVLLDLMLPGKGGLEVCKDLKLNLSTKHIPVIMLTAKGEEHDIVVGLELGADDYIVKPFSTKVVLARIRALLRRSAQKAELSSSYPLVEHRGILLDPKRFIVSLDKTPIELTSTEFKLLQFLLNNKGFVFTRSQIVDAVKGEDYPVTDRAVDVQIVGLRKKMGSYGELIETVRGIGYRLKE